MARAFSGLGKAKFADVTDGVLNYIMKRKSVRRSEILQKFYRDIDSWTLEQVERVLYQMKMISITILVDDEDVLYTYIEEEEE